MAEAKGVFARRISQSLFLTARQKEFQLATESKAALTGAGQFSARIAAKNQHYMKELFKQWTDLQSRRSGAALTRVSKLEHLAEEIRILETLLVNGFYNIPGETRDVRSILENRQKLWRDMQRDD